MNKQFEREALILGEEKVESLKDKTVAIFGIGGVGGYVCEALSRSGIGHFVLVDNDEVSETNINRQIIALHSTIGKSKVEVMKDRILDINPEAKVEVSKTFYLPEKANEFKFAKYDYVVDAIDTVTAKIDLIIKCQEKNIPIISSMGTGNKLDPTKLVVTDITKTKIDPLAKVMRKELKNRNVKHLKVVYSEELPIKPLKDISSGTNRRSIPGSSAFVPPSAGLIIASEVIKDLLNI